MRLLVGSCLLLAGLSLIPSAQGDSFEKFSVQGTFLNGPTDTLSGGFVVDENTGQVALADLFVTSPDIPTINHEFELNLVTGQGATSNGLGLGVEDALGDGVGLAISYPGNSGTFAGYTGGILCAEDTSFPPVPTGCMYSGGISITAFSFPYDGSTLDELLSSGSIVDDGPLGPPRATPEPSTLALLGIGIACLWIAYRRMPASTFLD